MKNKEKGKKANRKREMKIIKVKKLAERKMKKTDKQTKNKKKENKPAEREKTKKKKKTKKRKKETSISPQCISNFPFQVHYIISPSATVRNVSTPFIHRTNFPASCLPSPLCHISMQQSATSPSDQKRLIAFSTTSSK